MKLFSWSVSGFVRTIDSYISPSALHWPVANKFIRRRMLLSKRPFSPPVESHHTSNYKLDEKRFKAAVSV